VRKELSMATIEELKGLMLKIGIKESIVNEVTPAQPIAGRVMDSADYPAFLVAVEERYGVQIDDRYALKLKSLNDFVNFINGGK
jgi:acyl carrier protein